MRETIAVTTVEQRRVWVLTKLIGEVGARFGFTTAARQRMIGDTTLRSRSMHADPMARGMPEADG